MTIDELNTLPDEEFVARLGGIYEDSPWAARAALAGRPFASFAALGAALRDAVEGTDEDTRIALLRAHPELARRARMSDDSVREQAGAGLDRLTAEEYAEFAALNHAYRAKFGFPFVVAVKGLDKNGIRERLEARLANPADEEFRRALDEVHRIAGFRLAALTVPEQHEETA